MGVSYKQRCKVCKKNMVLIEGRNQFPICYECHKKQMDKPIEDKTFKKLFDIPEEFYKENLFLRSIKINYLRYQNLSDKQIECFKKTVEKMKVAKK